MDTSTMPRQLASCKTTYPHGSRYGYKVTPLRDFVRKTWPDHYRKFCEFHLQGRDVIRTKRFLGDIVDSRTIGTLPDGIVGEEFETTIFSGWLVGDALSIQTMRRLAATDANTRSHIRSVVCSSEEDADRRLAQAILEAHAKRLSSESQFECSGCGGL